MLRRLRRETCLRRRSTTGSKRSTCQSLLWLELKAVGDCKTRRLSKGSKVYLHTLTCRNKALFHDRILVYLAKRSTLQCILGSQNVSDVCEVTPPRNTRIFLPKLVSTIPALNGYATGKPFRGFSMYKPRHVHLRQRPPLLRSR